MSLSGFNFLEMETNDPEENWSEILTYVLWNQNDDVHTFHLIEVFKSDNSPLWKFDGFELSYPDYKTLDKVLGSLVGAYIVFLLYKGCGRVKVIAFDESGCPIS